MKHKNILSLICITTILLTSAKSLASDKACMAEMQALKKRVELLERELEEHEGKSVSYPISRALWGAGLTFGGHKLIKVASVVEG